jgi:hypothetical protein
MNSLIYIDTLKGEHYGYLSYKNGATKLIVSSKKMMDVIAHMKVRILNNLKNNKSNVYIFYRSVSDPQRITMDYIHRYRLLNTILYVNKSNNRHMVYMTNGLLSHTIYSRLDFLIVYNDYKTQLLSMNAQRLRDVYLDAIGERPLLKSKAKMINNLLKYKRLDILNGINVR